MGRPSDWDSLGLESFLYSTLFYLDKEGSYSHHLLKKKSNWNEERDNFPFTYTLQAICVTVLER